MPFIESLKQRARDLQRDVTALWFAYRNPLTPWYAKVFSALVVAYALSPIDLIPDFIPVLGYLDDLILIPAGVALALKMIPPEIMEDSRRKAAQTLIEGSQKNWLVGGIIIAIWAAVLFFIGKWIYSLIEK
jgi:uncharacterized membrane protein YkvA (DUF1232 family)